MKTIKIIFTLLLTIFTTVYADNSGREGWSIDLGSIEWIGFQNQSGVRGFDAESLDDDVRGEAIRFAYSPSFIPNLKIGTAVAKGFSIKRDLRDFSMGTLFPLQASLNVWNSKMLIGNASIDLNSEVSAWAIMHLGDLSEFSGSNQKRGRGGYADVSIELTFNPLRILPFRAIRFGHVWIDPPSKISSENDGFYYLSFGGAFGYHHVRSPKPTPEPTPPIVENGDQPVDPPIKPKSDVDLVIPKTEIENRDAIAVVIGNRDYKNSDVPSVEFAIDDAQTIRNYLVEAFGFLDENIFYFENATVADLRELFGTEKTHKGKLFNRVKPGISEIFVYYSGHGAPAIGKDNEAFLVPIDCDPDFVVINGYPLSQLYQNLSQIEYKQATVIIESCFSGGSHGGMLLKDLSSLVIPELKMPVWRNGTIFTSSTDAQVSSWYRDQNHGLFTYFFLKGLRGGADLDGNGKISVGEMEVYLTDRANGVPHFARKLHDREQLPTVHGDRDRIFFDLAE